MRRRGYLVAALSRPGFRRLFGARLLGQFGDGIFQASLAGTVLFNPERQGNAADIAAAFAVLLVPYSVIGPFAGVFLDRWWRQRVLVRANLIRAVVVAVVAAEIAAGWGNTSFYTTALVAVSISRFVLASLSASLPHVVPGVELVTTNALTTTFGTIATSAGGGAAIAARAIIGDTNDQYALIALTSGLAYIAAALVGRGFALDVLGPDEVQRQRRETVGEVTRGLLAGARHVRETPAVARGLSVVGVQRLGAGLTIVCTVLMYRNRFHGEGLFRAGLAGLTQVVTALAIGGGLAAILTPGAFRRIGVRPWVSGLLAFGAAVQVTCILAFTPGLTVLASFLLGFVAQGIKITIDTVVQQQLADRFRGRVFSLYDALVNLTLVAAAVMTALVLPEDGHSPACVIAIGAGYLLTAALFVTAGRESPVRPTTS